MKEGQRGWTRDELILAINLYCKLPFGKLHSRNSDIIRLAAIIGRSANSLAFKLNNFASLDPTLKARGIKGAVNVSKLDREIWNEFYNHWEEQSYESEKLLAKFENSTVEKINAIAETDLPKAGKERERIVRVRVNQSFFRKALLASYNNTCCITGIKQPELLVAGHIKPWAVDEQNRMNPSNGLLMNGLHDKAYETGLISIAPEGTIHIAAELKKQIKNNAVKDYFLAYEGKQMIMPSRFLPDAGLLQYHLQERFRG